MKNNNNQNVFSRLGAWLKERVRKFFVALKKNPQSIPLVALGISFLQFSLNLTDISNTTAKIQGQGMGLSAFVSMLFMILSFVCMFNAYPKRKKPVYAMVGLMTVLYAAVIYADIHYIKCIDAALTREISPIVITKETEYIAMARDTLSLNIVLVAITVVCVLLEPVFATLLKKIKTSIEVESGRSIDSIDISSDD